MTSVYSHRKITSFILFALVLVFFFQFVKPMITIILSSILLAYVAFPLQKRISKKILNKPLSIIFSLFVVVLIILVPFSFLAFEVIHQGNIFYDSLSDNYQKGSLFGFRCNSVESEVCSLINQVEKFNAERLSAFGLDKQAEKIVPIVQEKITEFIIKLPLLAAGIFITLVISYFLLKDWENILKKTRDLLPMRKDTVDRIIDDFENTANKVIYAQLFVAIVQGLVATIGFYIFGLPFPIVLGVIVAFFSLIPTIGTALIWFPASAYLMISGYLMHDNSLLGRGIGLFFYGLLIISTIDNILLAKIIHSKAQVNPILVIIGVIAGAAMFGFMGIFIGPILLPLMITYFEEFKKNHL